jgi:glycosyltransferase involved in cell wall biosynthesis
VSQVTVVITTYNAGTYLKEAVASVFEQTYTDWQLIIIDDGSTDGSLDLLTSELQDPRIITVVNPHNLGQTQSLNVALHNVTTPYMIQLDSDDRLYPHTLQWLLQEAQQIGPDVAVISGNIRVVWQDAKGHILRSKIRRGRSYHNRYQYMLSNQSVWPRFYVTAALRHVGGWPTDGPYQGRYIEDLRILFRLIRNYRFHWINRIIYMHRRHRMNMTLKRAPMQRTLVWLIQRTLKQWGGKYIPRFRRLPSGYPRLVALVPSKKFRKHRKIIRYRGK